LKNKNIIPDLFEKLAQNSCSPDEVDKLVHLVASENQKEDVAQIIEQELRRPLASGQPDIATKEKLDKILIHILAQNIGTPETKPGGRILLWRSLKLASTVAALLLVSFLVYKGINRTTETLKAPVIAKQDVAPGGDKAVLILADGSRIVLNNAQNGTLTNQGNTAVMKSNNQVIYDASKSSSSSNTTTPSNNTIITPRGGQYKITLPDGSKVWMNAATSMTFPTAFVGKERRIKINGEAYFEITKNANQPFIVNVNDKQEVRVLGTHFNIGAYQDEPSIKTTLLEGSVRVTPTYSQSVARPISFVTLIPGQQAQFKNNGELTVSTEDTDDVTAWKDGYFRFNNTDVAMIVRQLNRWYNVDVRCETDLTGKYVSGFISRNVNISKVLEMLEYTAGIKYKIEGTNITISH